MVAIQAEYADSPDLIPQASSLMTFLQLLGAVCGISIAGAVFGNQLGKDLGRYADQISPEVIAAVKQSVTFIFTLPTSLQDIVIDAYIKAVNYAFFMVIASGAVAIISGLFVRNWNLKQRGAMPKTAAAAA